MPEKRRYTPGQVTIRTSLPSRLPEGWETRDDYPGCIVPKRGVHRGVPMFPNSALAKALGWPGRIGGKRG